MFFHYLLFIPLSTIFDFGFVAVIAFIVVLRLALFL